MSFDPSDAFTGQLSDCCGAQIMLGEICQSCREHCNPQEEEEGTPTIKARVKLRPTSLDDAWVIEKDDGGGAGWETLMLEGMPRLAGGYHTLEQASADIESIASQLRAHQIEVEILPAKV